MYGSVEMERVDCVTDEKKSKYGHRVMKARAMGEVSSTRQLPGCAEGSSSWTPPAEDVNAAKPVRNRRGYSRHMPYL